MPLQLSKEEEVAAGDEVEVRREDQDKINKFSRLHQKELNIEEELRVKHVRRPFQSLLLLPPFDDLLIRQWASRRRKKN